VDYPKTQRIMGRVSLFISGLNAGCIVTGVIGMIANPVFGLAEVVALLLNSVMAYACFKWYKEAFVKAEYYEELDQEAKRRGI